MNLIRWNPAYDLLNVHSELDRVFEGLLQGSGFSPRYNGNGASAPAFLPVDIRREGNAAVIEASVPGFKPEEVEVTVDGGVLTISANHEETTETEGEYMRRERYVGRFYRQIALGEQVDGDRAEAQFDNGVLRVTVPLVTKPEPRRIRVASGAGGKTQKPADK